MRARDTILVLFILILIAIIPWVDGYLFKKRYLQFISSLNTATQHNRINVVEYRLGWLGSSVTLKVDRFNNIDMSGMTIEQGIIHGPYVYDVTNKSWTFALAVMKSDVVLPGFFTTVFIKQSEKSDLHADTRVSFLGEWTHHFVMPVFTVKLPLGVGKIELNGVIGDMDLVVANNRVKHISSTAVLGSIKAESDQSHVIISNIAIKYDINLDSDGLWTGTSHVQIPGVVLNDVNGVIVSLSDMSIDKKFGVDKYHLYNAGVKISVKKGQIADMSVLPSVIDLSIENLNSKGLVEIYQALPNQQNDNDKVNLLLKAMNLTSVASQKTRINTSLGRVESSGKVFWPNESDLPKTMSDFLLHYRADIDVRASISLVDKMIELIFGSRSQPSQSGVVLDSHSPRSEQNMLDQVSAWVDQRLVALDIAYQLKDLIKRKLAEDIFASNIDRYVLRKELPENIATQLKTEYTALYPNPNKKAVLPSDAAVAQPIAVVKQELTPADVVYQKLDDWVKQGILKKDKEDYVAHVMR